MVKNIYPTNLKTEDIKPGLEGGREWYKFLRGESISDSENVECLKVNDEALESIPYDTQLLEEFARYAVERKN